MSADVAKIKREMRLISRYIGTASARWITFVLMIPALLCLSPSVIYLMILTVMLPLAFGAFLPVHNQNGTDTIKPSYTARKYHFCFQKYQAEKTAAPLVLLLLLFWQYRSGAAELPAVWRIYPSFILVVNILSRLSITLLFRLHLHRRFLRLDILED